MSTEPPAEPSTGPDGSPGVVRAFERATEKTILRLSPEAYQALEWIAHKYGDISLADAMSRALGTAKFLLEESDRGCTVIIEDKAAGRLRKLVLG